MQCTNACKRVTICGLTALAVISVIFVFLNQWYGELVKPELKSQMQLTSPRSNSSGNMDDIHGDERLNEIQQDIAIKRRMVREDMKDYPYPNGKYNISATKLEDLVMEDNGKPIRSIIVSTFRSGSSFFGGIIGAHPGNFYHFEPLANFNFDQIRGPPLAEQAVKNLRALLNCEYAELGNLIDYEKKYRYLFNRTTYLWEECQDDNSKCYDHRYLSAFCKLFPFQSMKLVRLRLRLAEELLADEKLAVRLVLLVRDPRATMQSRKHVSLLEKSVENGDPAPLCADLVSDYEAAVELQKKYPTTFRALRYEDLTANLYDRVEEISAFLGRDFHPNVKEYLDTHTKADSGNVFATTRNSKTAPYHWRTDLDYQEVDGIQRACTTAMEYWGYLPAMNATHQREFNPVTAYNL